MNSPRILLCAAVALGLAACEGAGTKQTVGTVGGAAAGGLLGSTIGGGKGQLAATAAGALLGALAGSEVGKSLDRADQLFMRQTSQRALETAPVGRTVAWTNPDTGNSGTVTPTRPATTTADGTPCREYQQTVTVGGKTESAYGNACRQADGSWKIIN